MNRCARVLGTMVRDVARRRADATAGILTVTDGVSVSCGGAIRLRLDVVATEEGVMSGARFAAAYGVASGEPLGSAGR